MGSALLMVTLTIIAIVLISIISLLIQWYKKPVHGKAIVVTGKGGTRISFESGIFVIPILHRMEIMDITVKTITISRIGSEGLICKDNLRADIKVSFFVRINNTVDDARRVALSIGCDRVLHPETLSLLFDAKFSEALKTAGKKFDFIDLYTERNQFKHEILQVIGKDLNGYILDDCAIDYLEQTPLDSLKKDNILDSEGIKKIIELTSKQQILANEIEREKEKTIKKTNVETRETILELERQLTEKEENQKREVANIKARQGAEIIKVDQEQKLIGENARIETEQAVQVAEQNKERQVIVALRNKERTDAIEQERVKKDRELEINERERIVTLAQIEKEKAVEEERKNIQDVIRERVSVQRAVAEAEEKIKDTHAFAEAQRNKNVAITDAEKAAEQELVRQIKLAEAEKKAAELKAQQKLIEAEAQFAASGKEAEALKTLAQAKAAQEAAKGMSEAQVMEAKAKAQMKQGDSEAYVIEKKAVAEANGILANKKAEAEGNLLNYNNEITLLKQKGFAEAEITLQKGTVEVTYIKSKAEAEKEKGFAEATVIQQKFIAEANGIKEKAEAMKLLDGVGKEHEEFKLQLNKDKEVELAQINIQKDIANAQANVISTALKNAKIEIVGGETTFFDKIVSSISWGKSVEHFIQSSNTLNSVKEKFLPTEKKNKTIDFQIEEKDTNKSNENINSIDDNKTDSEQLQSKSNLNFKEKIKELITNLSIPVSQIKNLIISDLLDKLLEYATDDDTKAIIYELMEIAKEKGYDKLIAKMIGIK